MATDSVIPRQSMSSPFESEMFIPEVSFNHGMQRECRCYDSGITRASGRMMHSGSSLVGPGS